MRLRSGGEKGKTPYGFFALDKKSGKWRTIGVAADYSRPVNFDGRTIDPETFFYSRLGTDTIDFGAVSYKISRRQGMALVEVKGRESGQFLSGKIGGDDSLEREYQFKYAAGTKLWFDLRAFSSTRLYSEGIGWFDTESKTFRIFTIKELGLREQETVITRMNGTGRELLIGVSFCKEGDCLSGGGVVALDPDSPAGRLYTSENSPIPPGAVLDLVPEENLVWIVTSGGIVQWNPDKNKGKKYAITGGAKITGVPAMKFCADGGPVALPFPHEAKRAKVTGADGGGFYISVDYVIPAWIDVTSPVSAVRINEKSTLLEVLPGKRIDIYSSPGADGKIEGEVCGTEKPIRTDIIEIRNGKAKIDLSNHIWVPAENVSLEIR